MTALIPGVKCEHIILTAQCRKVDGSFETALQALRDEYQAICDARKDQFNIHLVLTVEEIKQGES